MVSPILCPKSLVLVLAIFIIFSVTLTENLQIADGLSAVANPLNFKLNPGETDLETWEVINNNDEKGWVEFYASGPGSEFLTFEKLEVFEPRQSKIMQIYVTIPKDHPNNIEYKPLFFALKRGDPGEGSGTVAQVNVQLKKTLSIKIGDNPIYTRPAEEIKVVQPEEIIIPEREALIEAKQEKTVEEKLAEIKARNDAILREQIEEANLADQWEAPKVTATDKPEIKDDGYTPEPVMDKEPVGLPTCGFWEMILSWFGIKSDCI